MSVTDRWIGYAKCPNLSENATDHTCIYTHGDSLVAVGLTSSVSSVFGAFFIILTYIIFKELRTKARFVLLMIALSDLVNSFAYIFAFSFTARDVYYSLCNENKTEWTLQSCAIQSAFNLFATLASNCWTCVLGIHITCLFYRKNLLENNYLMGFAHAFCWGGPLLIVAPAYILNFLGPGAQSVNVGWCFVSNYSSNSSWNYMSNHIVEEFAFAKFWEIVTIFILTIVYTVSGCKLCRFNYQKDRIWAFRQRHDFRLIWIPLVYLVLRIWGHIRWGLEWSNWSSFNSCPPKDLALAFLQIIGDTGQGWANALLYIIFNQAMRERIFKCDCIRKKEKSEKMAVENDNLVSRSSSHINYGQYEPEIIK